MEDKLKNKLFAGALAAVAICCAGEAICAGFERSAADFVKDMKIGVNIGNTLDVPNGDEVSWGNPKITRELIKAYKEKGFDTIRIPISWRKQFDRDDPEHKIRPEFLSRVKEVVDMCMEEDLITIINIHHDGGDDGWPGAWLTIDGEHVDRANEILSHLWTQIALVFRDYDEKLIFEGFNEVRKAKAYEGPNGGQKGREDWTGNEYYCGIVNRYAKTFYDSVRATGGNNAKRYLMIPTYAAAFQETTCKYFQSPNPDDNRIIVDIHCYEPGDFCIWGNRKKYDAGHVQKRLGEFFPIFKRYFTDKGIPVVLGEINADLRFYDAERYFPNDDARIRWARHYVSEAAKYGFPCIVWETGDSGRMGLIDRKTYKWTHGELADTFVKTAHGQMTDELEAQYVAAVTVSPEKVYVKTDTLLKWDLNGDAYRSCWGQTMGYGNLNGNGVNMRFFSSDKDGSLKVSSGGKGGNMIHQQFWSDQSVESVRTFKSYIKTHDDLSTGGRKLVFTVTAHNGTAVIVKGSFMVPGLKKIDFGADAGKDGCIIATKERPVVEVAIPLPDGSLDAGSKKGVSAELQFIPGAWGANLPLDFTLSKIEIK